MPRINLLPWREDERKERKLAFTVALGVSALGAALVTFAVYLMFGSMIDAQEQRNDKLRAEIKKLDQQIEEINNLESAKQKFIARMEIIEKLQRSRPEIVHVFDEIVRTLPGARRNASSTARAERSPTATWAASLRDETRFRRLCSELSDGSGDCSTTTVLTPRASSAAITPYCPRPVVQRFAWKMSGRSVRTARRCSEIGPASHLFAALGTRWRSVPLRAARIASPTCSSTASTEIS